MANVTVLGAGSTTVTIALSSQQVADAAQIAINAVNKNTALGIVDQQTWSGTGTLPAPQNILGGAIISTPGDVGALTSQYISVAVNAIGRSTVIGPQNFNSTVVAGDGSNLTYGNLSSNGQIFFGDSQSALINFGGNANLTTDAGDYVVITKAGSSSNILAGNGALVLTSDLGGGSGSNKIDLAAGAKASVIAAGNSTVPITVNAATGNDLFFVNNGAGSGIINPGGANVTIVGNSADLGGRTTLFGGTGSVVVSNGQGEFTGSTAGKNLMFSSTVAGSATLTGGGSGDQLFALGKGQQLIAGAGSETLVGRNEFTTGPSTYIVGNGFATVFGGTQGGNLYLFSGLGSGLIDGRDETAGGPIVRNTYQEFGSNPGGTHLIGDFVTGTDVLVTNGSDFAVTFFTAGQGGSPFGANAGTEVKLTNGTTYLFFDTGSDGKQDIFAADIFKA
jgi:hypothetical protein